MADNNSYFCPPHPLFSLGMEGALHFLLWHKHISPSFGQCVVGGIHSFPGAQRTIFPSCSDWFRDGNRSRWANESIPAFFTGTKKKMFFPLQLPTYEDINLKLPEAVCTFWRKSAQERGHTEQTSEMTMSEPESSHPCTRLFHPENQ